MLVVQRGCRCPDSGKIPGQFGWGFDQSGLMNNVPPHGMEVGTTLF